MKKHLLALSVLALPLLAMAKLLPDTTSKTTPPTVQTSHPVAKQGTRISLQLEAGTQGVGGDLRFKLAKKLSLRTGATFIPITANNAVSLPGFESQNTITVNFFNAHLLADWVPFGGVRSLRLVGGAAYFYKAEGSFFVIPTGSYKYGNTTVTGADIGNLNMSVAWKGVAPYAGLGLFRSFPKHFFNVNLDLGVYYLTAPQTHIVGTGLLADNSQLEPQFNENLKDYRWMPVIQLNFNFRLH
jgi:hypothetical protein